MSSPWSSSGFWKLPYLVPNNYTHVPNKIKGQIQKLTDQYQDIELESFLGRKAQFLVDFQTISPPKKKRNKKSSTTHWNRKKT